MPYERTGYAPWSLTREAGVQSATVDGTIQVPQYIQPTIDTGFIDEIGNWKGRKSSDDVFIGISKAEAVANGASVLFPDTNNHPSVNMNGFNTIFIALKPSNGGNVGIKAVMGPDTIASNGLQPVNAGATLKYSQGYNGTSSAFTAVLDDSTESLTADVWNIFRLEGRMADFGNTQFSIENNSGGSSNIEFAFRRTTI